MRVKSGLLTLLIIILFVVIIGIAILVYNSPAFRETAVYDFISNLLPKGETEIVSKVLAPDIKGAADYGVCDGTIIIAQEQGVFAMDKNGEWLWDRKVNLKKPFVKSMEKFVLVADLEGQAVLLFENNKFKWQSDFKAGVINVDLTPNGTVTVVHKEDDYPAAVSVMNKEGNVNARGTVRFTRKISGNHVVSAISSFSGEQLLINGFSTDGGTLKSTFNFLRASDGESFTSKVLDNKVFPLAFFMKNNSVILCSSDTILSYKVAETAGGDQNNDVLWEKAINNSQILAADVLEGKYLIAATGTGNGIFSTSGGSDVVVYDSSGKEKASFNVPGTVKLISAGMKNIFAVSTDNEVYFYNIDGKFLYKHSTLSEVVKVSVGQKENVVFTKKDMHILSEEAKKNE